MVAPLVEALLLRALRGRGDGTTRASPNDRATPARPSRLVGEPHVVDSVGYVAERTSVLLWRPGGTDGLEVLRAGDPVLPALLGRTPPTAVVVSHEPVDVWLRVGPFETRDARTVQQVELSLTLTLSDAPSSLRGLVDPADHADHADTADGRTEEVRTGLAGLGTALLDRLAHEVADTTSEALLRRTLADLTSLSLQVLLDAALPQTFLGGLLARSRLEVVDVDWPTEGRGVGTVALPWAGAAPAGGTRDAGAGQR